jgi:hypothetical protein
VPYHYGLHSLHLVSGVSPSELPVDDKGKEKETNAAPAPEGRAWQFYCKSEIDYPNRLRGTTVIALWERKRETMGAEPGVHRFVEQTIRKWVHAKSLDAQRVEQLLLENLLSENPIEPWAALLRGYEGLFLISDHPGSATVISTPSCVGSIRFYASDLTNSIRFVLHPPPHCLNSGHWLTTRVCSAAETHFPYQQTSLPASLPQPKLVVRHHQKPAQARAPVLYARALAQD